MLEVCVKGAGAFERTTSWVAGGVALLAILGRPSSRFRFVVGFLERLVFYL